VGVASANAWRPMCQWQKLRSVTLRTFARRPRLQERGLESRGNHRDAPRSLVRAKFFEPRPVEREAGSRWAWL
jgi:hypothetical protein